MRGVFKLKHMFTNQLNIDLPLRTGVEKTYYCAKMHSLSGKEKVPGAKFIKNGHANSLQGHERIHHWCFDKDAKLNSASYGQFLDNIHLLNHHLIMGLS